MYIKGDKTDLDILNYLSSGLTRNEMLERLIEEGSSATSLSIIEKRIKALKERYNANTLFHLATIIHKQKKQGKLMVKKPKPLKISRQEKNVLILLREGKRSSEVASILGLSEKSVGTYMTRIKDKIGLHKKSNLYLVITTAIEKKLI